MIKCVFYAVIVVAMLFATSYSESKTNKPKQKEWSASEYSGKRDDKSVRTVLLSKGFTWLSGSPADNEILSIGKSSQFFGFVALRYESGRAAKRGSIGRMFHQIATPEQRAIILTAVENKTLSQKLWWEKRNNIMDLLENTLYTGEPLDEKQLDLLASEFGFFNAKSALIEARAIAELEDLLSEQQWNILRATRKNPDKANMATIDDNSIRNIAGLSDNQKAQYEDLFAKAFSWLTGTMLDRQVIPRGQPAQFFGFVGIRHKSGHGASRGDIAKRFERILSRKQRGLIDNAVASIKPWVETYLQTRNAMLKEMELLRTDPAQFDDTKYQELAKKLGSLEIICASIEAVTYEKIERSMSTKQKTKLAEIRSDYVFEEAQKIQVSLMERGTKLMNLCTGCHKPNATTAPNIENIFNRSIADQNFKYSSAMQKYAKQENIWNENNLDRFLASPEKVVPGTKMIFKGLSNEKDRQAIISLLSKQ